MNDSIKNDSVKESETDTPLQFTGIADLLGKKSVRATFRLYPATVELISILAAQLGIKQKSLFDYLMEDEAALHAAAESRPPEPATKEQRIQKTFVVSQRSLAALDTVAKHAAASRNDLIEKSIQRLLPVFEKERIRQQQRTKALSRIAVHFNQGKALMDDVKAMVGEDDTLYQSLARVMDAYGKAVADIRKQVDKGKRLSEFSLDDLERYQP
ncbi:hypothetical protein [uncultured Desulfosarcina sp.]|uniref:hypothetical protein n=1 Tax=uncultured Desulfosarcina sp. TaxID=218289 RepID=UPI0029C75F0C|nr:hypothetical protein [uncultured Desulfosarcina sp.]